ncbi:Ig-like domain-containing protein, partial [Persephonella sp.]
EADEDSDGFILMDYKWATEGVIHSAVVINSVIDPSIFNQRYIPTVTILGRWEIHFGTGSDTGEPTKKSAGRLDIYHIPGSMSFKFRDNRVGTFFDNNNNEFRVNGSYIGNVYLDKTRSFTFYFNRNNPDMKPGENQQGKIFNSFFSNNKKWMAGYYTDETDGKEYGFLAFKDFLNCPYTDEYCFKYGFREHPTEITDESYIGKWTVIDGSNEIKTFYLDSFTTDDDLKTYTGRDEYYSVEPDGTVRYHTIHDYQLKVNSSNPSEVEIIYTQRKLNPGSGYEETVEIYKGYLFKNNPYRMAGYYVKDGIKYPFYAERIKPPPLKVVINKPDLTYGFYGELYSGNIRFEAQVLNAEYYGLSSDYRVLWTVRRGYDIIGEGYVIDVTLPYTDGYIEIIACLTKENFCDIFKDPYSNTFISIVNLSPSVAITSPVNESTFCAGQDITFRADVTDPNGEDIIDSNIQWIFGDIGEKYGRTVTGKFLNPGSYIVTVRYADLGGEIGEDQITVNIENCTDYPPIITINSPENGSYMPDSTNTYSDETEDITIPVDYTASDPEDGVINNSDITWMLYIPDIDYTIVGTYNEYEICLEPTPLGCTRSTTIKQVNFDRVPVCVDAYLKASVFDSAGNFSEDSVFLKKRIGCNLI